MSHTVTLPEVTEGVTSALITDIKVKVGDTIAEGDALFGFEADKMTDDIPSPVAGVVTKILVAAQDDIAVGSPLLEIEVKGAGAPKKSDPITKKVEKPAPTPTAPAPEPAAPTGPPKSVAITVPELGEGVTEAQITSVEIKVGDQVQEGSALIGVEADKLTADVPSTVAGVVTKVLVKVNDNIKVGDTIAEIETTGAGAAPAPKPAASAPTPSAPAPAPKASPAPAATPAPASSGPKKVVLAGPATRKLARELGVDLALVPGSKRGGRIDIADVKKYVKSQMQKPAAGGGAPMAMAAEPLPDFSKFGTIERKKMPGIRKVISRRMTMAWNTIPHVFQFGEVDVTHIMDIKKRYGADFKAKGSSASPTNFFIKALAMCLSEFPTFNSSLDSATEEIVYKQYYNIGVAVDTPTGLLVPVLKNVDQMSVLEIGKTLKELAKKTRERKVKPIDLKGSCITLSNLGGIGGTHFTPIVNPPEVAIMGVGSSQVVAKFIDGKFVPRTVTKVTLSFDHRVIDGADGARFISRFTDILENFERTLLGG